MGLFAKKANPVVEAQGLRFQYDLKDEIWQFSCKGTEFAVYGATLVVPSLERLAGIQSDIDRLRPEMTRRMAASESVKINDGETYLVNLSDLQSLGTFEVCWSEGESWGDMGVAFTVKNHEITDESWGD